jgi:bifunctional non-homologous end joining protein LigD
MAASAKPPKEELPKHVKPMLAKLQPALPPDDDRGWAYEIKWDGVRALAYLDGGEARFESRTLESVTHRYPELAPLGEALGGRSAVLDGEIVALDAQDVPRFQLLQRRMGVSNAETIRRRAAEAPVTYMVFDLLHFDGHSTMSLPYAERRAVLDELGLAGPRWRVSSYHAGEGRALLELARAHEFEGVVGKRLDSPYRPGQRSGEWIKVRNRPRQEFVIGGWVPGAGRLTGMIGALLLGYWDRTPAEAERSGQPQRLLFAGGCGTGFTERERRRVTDLLAPLRRDTMPFAPSVAMPKRKDSVFCEPELVCDAEYSEWTAEETLRQASYKGLRDDKPAHDVVREDRRPGVG